jgi:uncharacterized protein YaaR (DUF327 family)
MKILKTGSKTQLMGEKAALKTSKTPSFSAELNLADKEQTDKNVKQMLDNIDKLSKRLITTRSVADAEKYKNSVRDYLSYVVKNIYVLRKETSPLNYGVHTRIEIINKKLDEITKEALAEQKNTIKLASKIEELRGLLVDVYK